MNNGNYGGGNRNDGEFSHIFQEGAYQYGNPFSPPPPKKSFKCIGLAIASLVLGIAALVTAAVVGDPVTAMVLAPGGIAFFSVFTAINHKLEPKAFVGILASAAAILVSVVLFILSALNLYEYGYDEDFFEDYFGESQTDGGETEEDAFGGGNGIFM